MLLRWDAESPTSFHADGHTVHDYENRFKWEDEGYFPSQKQFRWADIAEPQMNIFQLIKE